MLFQWNPKANPRNNKRWGVRLFHSAHSNCIRVAAVETGELPPKGFFPCEKCLGFYASNETRKAAREAFDKVHGA